MKDDERVVSPLQEFVRSPNNPKPKSNKDAWWEDDDEDIPAKRNPIMNNNRNDNNPRPMGNNNNNNNNRPSVDKGRVGVKSNGAKFNTFKKWLKENVSIRDAALNLGGVIISVIMFYVCIINFINQTQSVGVDSSPIMTFLLGLAYIFITVYQVEHLNVIEIAKTNPILLVPWTLFTLWDVGGTFSGLQQFFINRTFFLASLKVHVLQGEVTTICLLILSIILAFCTEFFFVTYGKNFLEAIGVLKPQQSSGRR